jgi:hypothetical protein
LTTAIRKNPDSEAKAICITTLGVLTFVLSDDKADTDYCLELFSEFFNLYEESKIGYSHVIAAITQWSFLVTTVEDSIIMDTLIPITIGNIVEILNDTEEFQLQLASGHTLALLSSIIEAEIETYSPYYFNGFFDVKQTLEVLTDKAYATSKRANRKDKARQKQAFEPILLMLKDGQSPHDHITLRGQSFEFDSWKDIIRLGVFRNTLGSGFQNHFLNNPLMSAIFEIELVEQPKLNKIEKRLLLSPSSATSKNRTLDRDSQRKLKQKVRGFDEDFDLQ